MQQPPLFPNLPTLEGLDSRSADIFRLLVESYLGDGTPVGSRNLSRMLPNALSPATIRNVMSDLEALGLIYAPHISAGRMPTQQGLRFFVDSFMEVGDLPNDERQNIDAQVAASGKAQDLEGLLTGASKLLSGMSNGAGLVVSGKSERPLKHIEFVQLEPTKALAVIVNDRGNVENRIIATPAGVTVSQLAEASNYLNAHLRGKTLLEARATLEALKEETKQALDSLSQDLVERGIAMWSGQNDGDAPRLIVRGRSNLLTDMSDEADMERMRLLFDDLEAKGDLIQLLTSAEQGSGVRIFIGSENPLFSLSGSSLVVAPYRDNDNRVIGALGVIGPTRLNYARIVPMVNYTANLVSRLLR